MKYSREEEKIAEEEYLSMIDTLQNSEEFQNEWSGQWESFCKETFGKKDVVVKGDKEKYMKYWLQNQKIINDNSWNVFTEEPYQDYMDNEFDI